MYIKATLAPASAIAFEASQPMPRVPPVMTATFPSRRKRERTLVSFGGPGSTIVLCCWYTVLDVETRLKVRRFDS